jgi:hypothetical protein
MIPKVFLNVSYQSANDLTAKFDVPRRDRYCCTADVASRPVLR